MQPTPLLEKEAGVVPDDPPCDQSRHSWRLLKIGLISSNRIVMFTIIPGFLTGGISVHFEELFEHKTPQWWPHELFVLFCLLTQTFGTSVSAGETAHFNFIEKSFTNWVFAWAHTVALCMNIIFKNSLMKAMTTCFTEATRLLESSGSSVWVWQEEEQRLPLYSLRCFGKSRKQMNPPPLSEKPLPFLRNRPRPWKKTLPGPQKWPKWTWKKIIALTHIDNPFFAKNWIQFGIF